LLLLDQHPDVRQVALDLVQACTVVARDYNVKTTAAQEEHMRKMKAQAALQPQGASQQPGQIGQQQPQLSPSAGSGSAAAEEAGSGGGLLFSSLTSWAVDGISKTLESAVIGGGAAGQSQPNSSNVSNVNQAPAPSYSGGNSPAAYTSSTGSSAGGSVRDIGADADSFDKDAVGGGWGDEDLDIDFDEGEKISPKPTKAPVAPSQTTVSSGTKLGTLPASSTASKAPPSAAAGASGSMKLKGAAQPVKAAPSNSWEDDEWMNDLIEEKPVATTLGTLRKATGAATSSAPSSSSSGTASLGGLKKPVVAVSAPAATAPPTAATAAPKSTKSIGAKKLVVDKTSDNWDDF
jgi:hypothetical protein